MLTADGSFSTGFRRMCTQGGKIAKFPPYVHTQRHRRTANPAFTVPVRANSVLANHGSGRDSGKGGDGDCLLGSVAAQLIAIGVSARIAAVGWAYI